MMVIKGAHQNYPNPKMLEERGTVEGKNPKKMSEMQKPSYKTKVHYQVLSMLEINNNKKISGKCKGMMT